MSNTIVTQYMSLPVPVVSVDPGPDYALNINACLAKIDGHDHSNGSGASVGVSGLNIDGDLSFNSNSATNILRTLFSSQASTQGGANALYFVNGNLYVNDGNVVPIQITSGGAIVGAPGNIANLGAGGSAATYVNGSKTFLWTASAGAAAAMDNGAVTIRETNVASANGITLASPSALAADYVITLPAALPGSTQVLNIDSSGNTSTISYDGIGAGMTSTGADAIGGSMTSTGANAVANSRSRSTSSSVPAGGVAISSSCGNFTTSSTSFVDVTNLSVTITTTGNPVWVGMVSDGTNSESFVAASVGSGTQATADVKFLRDASTISISNISAFVDGNGSNLLTIDTPASSFNTIDFVGAGTYTYKVQIKFIGFGTGPGVGVFKSVLVAYEL